MPAPIHPPEPSTVFYFIHLPKTAGTSLRCFLEERIYPGRLRTIYYDLGYWNAAQARAELTAQDVLYGHFCYGLHHLLRDPRGRYATMLRHPVDRVTSVYEHMKRDPATWEHQLIKDENLSLREFVERGVCSATNNHVTRMLAANYAPVYRWVHHAANRYSRLVRGQPFYQVHGRRHLRRALRNLREDFDFVGFTENFAATMDHLLRQHGLPTEGVQMPVDNVSTAAGAAALDPATLAAIETANELDLELYHTVRQDPEAYHAVGV